MMLLNIKVINVIITYKATQLAHLRTPRKSIHKGVKFQFNECDYKEKNFASAIP